MITKQSSRIYFRGKDYKDVFFNGKYYPVMAAKNGYGCDGVIWRKLYPDKYYMTRCSQWWLSGYQTVSSTGIYYNELDIYRERYRFLEDYSTVIGARFIAFAETAYKSLYGGTIKHEFIYLTKDGKYFKTFELDNVICAGPFFVPDGFVYVYNDGSDFVNGTSYFYHVVVDDNMNRVGEETLICSIVNGENGFSSARLIRCVHIGSDPDVILYRSSDSIYAISLDGSCVRTDLSAANMNYAWTTFQNGRFIMPLYASSNSVYTSYLAESSDGKNWSIHTFPASGVRGLIAVLWNGTKYLCYADRYYDSDNYCLEVYAGMSLGTLSLVNSLKGDGYPVSYVSGDKTSSSGVTLAFDSKYTESIYEKYDGIYRVNASVMLSMLTATACFENYKRRIPEEILIGSTALNKYNTYTRYWMLYIDNLYLEPSENNFICSNYVGTGEQKKWGTDIAEYYARR